MKPLFRPLIFGLAFSAFVHPSLHGATAPTVGNDNPTGPTGEFNGSITTAGSYDPYTGNASRSIDDLTVTGSVGAYPLKWTRILNTRGGAGPFGESGGWRHNYQWAIVIHQPIGGHPPPCVPEVPDVTIAYPDGRIIYLRREESPAPPHYDPYIGQGEPSGDRLVKVGGGDYYAGDYDLKLKDGGRVEFRHIYPTSGVRLVATGILDPFGQRTRLDYDSDSGLLSEVKEPAGRYLSIHYYTYSYETQINHIPRLYAYVTVIDRVQAFDRPGAQIPIETVGYVHDYDKVNQDGFETRFYKLTRVNYDDNTFASYLYFLPARDPDNYWFFDSARLWKCNDVRYAGPMGHIEYEYVTGGDVPLPATGQVKAEKNPSTGQAISQITYPPPGYYPPDSIEWRRRKETRADGATRTFYYGQDYEGQLNSYTDFAYPSGTPHTTTIRVNQPDVTIPYTVTVTDALTHTTITTKDPNIGAVLAVKRGNGQSVIYHYTSTTDPYYLDWQTDENLKTTTYTRDPTSHQVTHIAYPDGGSEDFFYNEFGQVLDHTMTSGGQEHCLYDSRGLKTHSWPPATSYGDDPGSHPTQYFYYGGPSGPGEAPQVVGPMRPDLMDRLQRVIDPLGNSTWYEYNGRGQVTKVIHSGGSFTQNFYNPDGTLQWTEDELHHRTSYEYDEYKRVTKTKNALNEETLNSYAPWNGHGPLSHTTSSVYLTTLPSLKKIKQDYDSNFRLIETTKGWDTAEAASTTNTYDEVGNLQTVKDPKGQTSHLVTVYEYDDRNRRKSMTDTLNHKTEWLYDDAGNLKKETRADLKFRTWDEYDAMNRVKHTTGFLSEPTSYDYDHAGNRTKITDANGKIYQTGYDALNRRKHMIYPIPAVGGGRYEVWRYDIAGNLLWHQNTSQWPALQFKHFEYDVRNRLRRSYWNNSESSITPDWSIGPETAIMLDAAGRVTEIRTNGGETVVAYGYDNANRKISEDQVLAGSPTHRVETIPDQDGNLGTLSVPGVPGGYSFTFDYTPRQQLWHIKRSGSSYVEFSYDPNGNLTRRQNMDQGQGRDATLLQYDDLNRVTICEQTGYTDLAFARSNYNDYDLVNNLKSISRHEDGDKGELFTYDDAKQLSSVTYNAQVPWHPTGGGGSIAVGTVEEDEEKESLAALEADPDREPLAKESVQIDSVGSGLRTVYYVNDALNRLSMTDSATGTTNFTPNHLNQYTAVTPPTGPSKDLSYDDGNLNVTGYDQWVYIYDAEKRLISALTANAGGHSAQFAYDGLGRCVKRTIDGATTVYTYDNWKTVVEWSGSGALVAWNLYGAGADEILVRYKEQTPATPAGYLHYHLDAMGNVQFLLSDQPNPGLEKYTYDVFGKPRITGWNGGDRPISNHGNRFLFTGREYVYTLGLYDYRHRFYHPELGRFIQTDPLGQQVEGAKVSVEQSALYTMGGAPEMFSSTELNLYRYCNNDPVNGSDPMGLTVNIPNSDQRDSVRERLSRFLNGDVRVDKNGDVTREGNSKDSSYDKDFDKLINSHDVYKVHEEQGPGLLPAYYEPRKGGGGDIYVNPKADMSYRSGMFSTELHTPETLLSHELMRAYAHEMRERGTSLDDSRADRRAANEKAVERANRVFDRLNKPLRLGYD